MLNIREESEFRVSEYCGSAMIYGSGKTKQEAFTNFCNDFIKEKRKAEDVLLRLKEIEAQIEAMRNTDPEFMLPFQETAE